MIASSIAAGGLASAMARFEQSAVRMSQGGSLDNLAGELVEQSQAKVAVAANIAVLKSVNETTGMLLDLFA